MGARLQPGRQASPQDRLLVGHLLAWGGLQTDRPPNLQLQLGGEVRQRIFAFPKSGQKRVDQLFREVQGRIVGRQVVADRRPTGRCAQAGT